MGKLFKKFKLIPGTSTVILARQAFAETQYEEDLKKSESLSKAIKDIEIGIADTLKLNASKNKDCEKRFTYIKHWHDDRISSLLPEIRKVFEERGYHVDIHNDSKYYGIECLIILSWQTDDLRGFDNENSKEEKITEEKEKED